MLGTSVGNYKVTKVIGSGGMGAVYLAQHTILRRPAAVKVLLPEMSQRREVVNRFFNEARAATAVRHPGIVEIYDFGYLADGSAYIIMEYLEGETLGRRLHRTGKMSAARALVATRQIAGALSAAHDQQIIHRDLKPDNLFIVRDADLTGGERIKLLDFGIAKLASEGPEPSHTRTGTVMGTPRYMSPEQCRGAGATVLDARADLYSLGCILYEMLCGRPPFTFDGDGEVISHHIHFPPERPQHHEPTIPDDVSALVLRLLEKNPANRPASASALLGEIEQLAPLPLTPQDLGPITIPPIPFAPTTPPVVATRGTTLGGAASQLAPVSPSETVSIKGPAGSGAEPLARRRWLRGAAGVGATAAVALVALKMLGGSAASPTRDEPTTPIGGSASPSPEPPPITPPKDSLVAPGEGSSATPQDQTAPTAATVVWQFSVFPADAPYKIFVGGEPLGGTRIDVPMSLSEELEIKVTARGYRTHLARLIPASSETHTIILSAEPRKPASSSSKPAPAPKPPSPGGSRVERFKDL